MIVAKFDPERLTEAFGIDMAEIEADPTHDLGVGLSWARVAPGSRSEAHQHDETEVFVITHGSGLLHVDGARQRIEAGNAVVFEPFETHVVENTGEVDLILADLYWRDATRAAQQAALRPNRRRFGERPVFVFSTPPTPNGDLHLGHLSGPYLGADAYVRFQRLNGNTAWHLTGSDDYQSYVLALAEREGRAPAEVAAQYGQEIRETLRLMDIGIDQFTVTHTDPDYTATIRDFFSRLVGSGRIRFQSGTALFDSEGRYLYEVDVRGGCPGCGETTNGNICEECGEPNVCTDLREPRANRDSGQVAARAVEHFVMPLHEFATEVREHHRLGRTPPRLSELAQRIFARGRLDVPLTHPSSWGVRPAGNDLTGTARDQVVWVWPEMSFGFLYGIEALGKRIGADWRATAPSPDWKIVHFFGYDNSFYHSVLYPALYRAALPEWEPSIDYHPNEFYLFEGDKFSTSRRHLIWGKEVLSPETVDAVRFFLCWTRPEGERTDFRRDDFESTVAEILVGRWQRWLRELGERVARHHDGRLPDAGVWTAQHTAFLDQLDIRLQAVTAALSPDGFSLNRAAAELDGLVTDAIRFAGEQRHTADVAGWDAENRTTTAVQAAAAGLLATTSAPLMPRFAERLLRALGSDTPPGRWPSRVSLLEPGTRVALAETHFFAPVDPVVPGADTQPVETGAPA
ncbi:class I tRNA ligase family protein [Halostreptopolyspora alba]|uniref:Cupin domain-containing protein n=1 Tax=Halostreptopolyspora alba TaxID=2487137 RepID=A0A3N0EHZ5_9ACTN|nr:cupin domain-containing protein [Nocardiopsaceae bacterium YIM 96095]